MSALISKIHVTNATGLSLNERFTAIATKPVVINASRGRSRSRSRGRVAPVPAASAANKLFLQNLARDHKIQTALKLKRRSIKSRLRNAPAPSQAAGNRGGVIPRVKRGTIKALRIGANGRPIKTNSFAKTATMQADIVANRRRPLRRSNSASALNGRGLAGGAPERVARRRLERLAGDGGRRPQNANVQRGRSRSRSRSRGRVQNNEISISDRTRSRSRSRSRTRKAAGVKKNVPIKARLGLRRGSGAQNEKPGLRNRNGRSASVPRRGVQQGRVTKNNNNTNGTGGAQLRGRSRSRVRRALNTQVRSSSRTRGGQQQQQQQQQNGQQARRTRSQSKGRVNQNQNRRGQKGRKIVQQKGGKNQNANNQGQGGVPRRGRSRSRGVRNGGAKNLGINEAF